jgi:hypothetical protein
VIARSAVGTARVLDGDLDRRACEADGQDGHEAGDLAAPAQDLHHLPSIGAQHAPVVLHADPDHVGVQSIHAAGEQAAQSWIPPVVAPAPHHVVSRIDCRDQTGNLLGRILQIGVQCDDDVAPGTLQPSKHRRVLAVVAIQRVHPDGRVPLVHPAENLKRRIPAAVVHEDHFVRSANPRQDGGPVARTAPPAWPPRCTRERPRTDAGRRGARRRRPLADRRSVSWGHPESAESRDARLRPATRTCIMGGTAGSAARRTARPLARPPASPPGRPTRAAGADGRPLARPYSPARNRQGVGRADSTRGT